MFAKLTPTPMLAVKDVNRARRFYAETMGLEAREVMDGILEVRAGDQAFVVYFSEYAGTNRATAMTWVVE
jgi:catechol 2,3-dioxygenase-like lactoylglutathione lyase family enzyme